MPKLPRKKSVPNSRRRNHSEVRRKVIEVLKAIKMSPKPYNEDDPYADFLHSFSLAILVEAADYIMVRYPHLKRVDTILSKIEDQLMLEEAERQQEERY